jgi:hypothetical protein
MATSASGYYQKVGFAPGESPFRVRGNTYVFHQDYVREHLPGGLEAQREALGALGKHDFFDTLFLANGWYDVFPLVAMGYACAEVARTSFEAFITQRAEDQVVKDLKFFRRMLVKLASPVAVASRLPGIAASYFEFATMREPVVEDNMARSVMSGVPELIADWMQLTTCRFIAHVMSVNGAHDVVVDTHATPEPSGTAALPTVTIGFAIGWRAGAARAG